MAEAYGLPRDVVAVMTEQVIGGVVLRVWVLEESRQAVSTVMTGRVQDVSLWCMSTPERFARVATVEQSCAVLDWALADGATIGLLGAAPADAGVDPQRLRRRPHRSGRAWVRGERVHQLAA